MRIRKRRQRYVSGSYLREDDRTGFDELRSDMTKEKWTGLVTRNPLIDNPVDRNIKGIKERRIRID